MKKLDKIYNLVLQQRFKDLVVIKTKFNVDPSHLILATAFSKRHLLKGTEELNKQYKIYAKEPQEDFAKISVAADWNVVDFKSIAVHLFLKQARDEFDIEQLWTVGEDYDRLIAEARRN